MKQKPVCICLFQITILFNKLHTQVEAMIGTYIIIHNEHRRAERLPANLRVFPGTQHYLVPSSFFDLHSRFCVVGLKLATGSMAE